jgi:hypothetical protein
MLMDETIHRIVSHIRRADSDVIIGPIRVGNDGTPLAGMWYFIAISADQAGEPRLDSIRADDEGLIEELRIGVMGGLIHGKPIVIHDTDDERVMMQMAQAIWPTERIKMLRERVEQEMSEH